MISDKGCRYHNPVDLRYHNLEHCMYANSAGNVQSLTHADCEAACIFFKSCIGYEVSNTYCYLYPSSLTFDTCPNGWKHIGKNSNDYDMAESVDNLVENAFQLGTDEGTGKCYVQKGGINLPALLF